MMPRPATSLGQAAACLIVLMFVTGCVGTVPATSEPSGTPSGPVPTAETGTSIPSTPTSTPAPTTPPDNNPVATILAWIVGLGPGSPNGPDEVDAYQLILDASEESCRAALQAEMPVESVDLYHGAAAACLAALHGKSARWDDAQAAYDALGGPPDGCLDRQAYDMLEFAVNAYREDPNTVFRIRPQNNTVDLRCPRIEELTVTRDATGNLDIAVLGDRLGRVLEVTYRYVDSCPQPADTVGTNSVAPTEQSRDLLSAHVPADEESPTATFIWVGLTAVPDPWVADARCSPIIDVA